MNITSSRNGSYKRNPHTHHTTGQNMPKIVESFGRNHDYARVIQVIETTLERRGDGKDDPIRIVTQYWSFDGELLAEDDPGAHYR